MVGAKPYGQLRYRNVNGKRMAYVEDQRPATKARPESCPKSANGRPRGAP